MATLLEWWAVTQEEFPFSQASAIRQVNDEKSRNMCIALEITDGTDIHCFVAVNGPEIDMPPITPGNKNVVWHYTKAPERLVFRDTFFPYNLIVASGTRSVKLINCRFADGGAVYISSGVQEVDIDKNQGPVRIRVVAK